MTATMQRAMDILKLMPEPEVEKFITMNIRYEKLRHLKDDASTRSDTTEGEFKALDDLEDELLNDSIYDKPKKPAKRTFGTMKDSITYIAPDFDSCFSDDPAAFGLEEYM